MPDSPKPRLSDKILSLWLLFLGWAWILMLGSGCLLLIFYLVGTLMGGIPSPLYAALFGVLMLVFLSAAVTLIARKFRRGKQEGQNSVATPDPQSRPVPYFQKPVKDFLWLFLLWCFCMTPLIGGTWQKLELYRNGHFVSGYVKSRQEVHCSNCRNYTYEIVTPGRALTIDSNDYYNKRSAVDVYYLSYNLDSAVIRSEPYSPAYVLLGDSGWVVLLLNLFLTFAFWPPLKKMIAFLKTARALNRKAAKGQE